MFCRAPGSLLSLLPMFRFRRRCGGHARPSISAQSWRRSPEFGKLEHAARMHAQVLIAPLTRPSTAAQYAVGEERSDDRTHIGLAMFPRPDALTQRGW